MSKAVAIDPSINTVGWACIDGIKRRKDGTWDGSKAVWTYGMWKIAGTFLRVKMRHIVEAMIVQFDGVVAEEGDHLIVEWPQYFEAQRGQIAAKRGHTINLAAIDAYIAGYFRLPDDQWWPVFPSDWKGNLSKEITRRRFFRELGVIRPFAVDHNAVDAAMMLLDWCKKHRVTNHIIDITLKDLDLIAPED